MTRRGTPGAATAGTAFTGVGSTIPTSCPGDGGGGGTSGRGVTETVVANGGVDTGTAGGATAGVSSSDSERNSSGASGSVVVEDRPACSMSTGDADTGVLAIGTSDGSIVALLSAGSVGAILTGEENDGVGRDGNGRLVASGSLIAGVARPLAAGVCNGVSGCGKAAFVSGVVEPTEIRTIAPQTLHRARTPFGGTFAGSTRNTERQS